MTPIDAAHLHDIQGRLAALEVVMLALVGLQDSGAFRREYKLVREAAITGLLPNAGVSDAFLESLEDKLKEYDEKFLPKLD